MRKNIPLVAFLILTIIFSIGYLVHVSARGGIDYVENETLAREFGKFLGEAGFFALALVYARSVLKIIIGQATFWKRLDPVNITALDIKKYSVKVLIFLNKTHAYLGVLAIAFIFLHCYVTGSYRDNLLLQFVLILMALEGITGFIMKLKYTPSQLKQKSYLIHRQFTIGAMMLILAAFGHLLLGD